MSTAYAELFCQSNFSFLHGASHPQELVQQAHTLGYQAIAITDECSVAGVVRAHAAIKEQLLNIKLIIGSYFQIDHELAIVLLCPNHQAYAELCRIITNARNRADKGEYRLDPWDLRSMKQCLAIWLPSGYKKDDEYWGKELKNIYSNKLWIGFQRHLVADEHHKIAHYESLSQQLSRPLVACSGVLMHIPQRLPLQHTLHAIRTGKSVAQLGRESLPNSERSLRPLAKLASLYKPCYIKESTLIAKRCSFNLDELSYQYPAELIPKSSTPKEYLRKLVLLGLQKRFPQGTSYAIKRILVKELKLIAELSYEHFFITIFDVVQFARQQRILYQGRGSAANSIVCYCLEITAVDPSQVEVLFERFISKERNEPPDIDVDFEHERREEVIQYIYQKYGRHRTALAATVITYRRKSAIREVGKALGINPTQLDFFIKNINYRDHEISWHSQLEELGFSSQSHQGKLFIDLVNEIKGFPRHLSQHVGGFVIASTPLYELVPIEKAAMEDRSVIQWDKDDLETLGLLKVDVLALGMLTAIRKSFDLIDEHYEHRWNIADITRLEDDPQVYNMVQQADTVGVFQIESRAQMSMLPRLKPANYYDLVIQIAIVRPGPIQGGMVHPFLKRRDGTEPVDYPSEAVKSVLSRTMGVPIFQEQVIKIAMVAAGFTGGEADRLRRAMGTWKKTGELLKFREKLIQGMLARNYSREFAERIFEQIKGFGEYGFPEAHSASFAVLAYVSSWLKYYYPEAFYVGLLNSWPMGFYSPAQLIQDAKRHHVEVLPICINHSHYHYSLQASCKGFAIRMGMRAIKGFSEKTYLHIRNNKPKGGFTSVEEVKNLTLPRPQLEALASANAFSILGKNRYATRWALMDSEHELPLFQQQSHSSYEVQKPSPFEDLIEDYASIKLTLNKHPICLLREQGLLKPYTSAKNLGEKRHKKPVSVVGLVIGRQRPQTSGGVTFMTLEDDTGNSNVIVWLGTARAQKKSFIKAKVARVDGILERGNGGVTHIIAGKITDLSHLLSGLNNNSRDFH